MGYLSNAPCPRCGKAHVKPEIEEKNVDELLTDGVKKAPKQLIL